ncbi:hypothetical protein [Planktothrix phage Pra-JY27]|nr:hypothetical protein [Planktothrix phage Pag-Yong1]WEV89265.1 hypothetical protein [Synechococcus phage MinM2]
MPTHTRGPWRAVKPGPGVASPPAFWITDGTRRIADVRDQGPETRANADVIGAAADMLDALHNARLVLRSMRGEPSFTAADEKVLQKVEAAIAKAEGRE